MIFYRDDNEPEIDWVELTRDVEISTEMTDAMMWLCDAAEGNDPERFARLIEATDKHELFCAVLAAIAVVKMLSPEARQNIRKAVGFG